MGLARTGRAGAIRAFVAAHPNCTAAQVHAALGGELRDICNEISRLVKSGGLVAERAEKRIHYLPGTAPWESLKGGHPLRKLRETAPKPEFGQKNRSDYRPARLPVSESVEEFVRNGGTIEKCPTHWDEHPTHYPPVRLPLVRRYK